MASPLPVSFPWPHVSNVVVSLQFPMCNGSHVKHNKETGDNVGPLIISQE